MHLFDATWVLLLLPLLGVAASVLAETRRGVGLVIMATTWLALAAALVVLAVTVAHHASVHESTITFWSFSVTQTPFNAASRTLLAARFQVGIGYAATPAGTIMATAAAVVSTVAQTQMLSQLRSDPRLPTLMRLAGLGLFAVLLVVLAPGVFQLLVGFGIGGLIAALLAGAGGGPAAVWAVRRTQAVWGIGGGSLLLAAVFIYVKFSGTVALAATVAKPPPTASLYGLNLQALAAVWAAVPHGTVQGVGGRTVTLAAVLLLVAAAAAAGQVPLHGMWRGFADAPSGAATALAMIALGTSAGLLEAAYPLLKLAPGVLPAAIGLGAVTAVVAAGLAMFEVRLRRLSGLVCAANAGMVMLAFGVGNPAAGVATAVAALVLSAALGSVVGILHGELRVDRSDRLPMVWREARPLGWAFLLTMAAAAGWAGAGMFFSRSEVMAAGLAAGVGHGAGLAAALLASLFLAAALGRLARDLLRGREVLDPREARAARRHLSQGRRQASFGLAITAAVLALLVGLLSLPGVRFGVGPLLAEGQQVSALPVSGAGLLLALLLPLASGGVAYLLGATWPTWPAVTNRADGAVLFRAGERLLLGYPAAAAEVMMTRVWEPVADRALAAFGWAAELAEAERPWTTVLEQRVGLGVLGILVILVAAVAWWGRA